MCNVNDDSYKQRSMNFLKSLLVFLTLSLLTACGEEQTPQQHIDKAKSFLAEQKIFEGIIELKNALQKEGNLPEARWLLGEAYLKLGNGSLAQREFNSARSLGYSHDDFETNVLRALNLQGKFQEVLDKTAAPVEEENSAELQVIRGDAYAGLSQIDAASKSFQDALALDETSSGAYTGLARLALSQRQMEQTDNYIEKGLKLDPENDALWTIKGMLSLIRNAPAEAETAFAHAVKLAPYSLMARIGLIRAYYTEEKFEAAVPELKALERRYVNSPTVKYLRAYMEYRNQDIDKAREVLQDVIKISPDHPESLLLLSNILYQDGKLEQVISYMERFTSRFPNHPPAIKLLAVSYLGQKDPEKAIELIQNSLEMRTADDQLYSILGTAYIRAGNIEKATEYLERAAEINPNAANIRAQLALSHLAAGDTDLAVSALEEAVELDPKMYSADIMLILTHIRSGNHDEAIKAAENLNHKEPDNPLPLNLLGAAHAGKKDYSRAREYFKKAISKKADYTPAKFNLANLDVEEGNYDEAQKRFEEIIAADSKNAKAYVGLARLESKRGNEDRMLEYLNQARKVDEKSIDARVLLARYYKNTSRHREMLEVIKEAAQIGPNFTEVIFLAAQAQRLNGQYEIAEKNLELLLREFPESIEALMEKALLLADQGSLKKASDTINKILSLKDDHERALLTRFNLSLRQGELEQAQSDLDAYVTAYPESLDAIVSRGDMALYRKEYPAALQIYQQALQQQETSLVVFRIVNTYLAMNDKENARGMLEQWIKEHPDDKQVKLVLASRYQQENDIERAIQLYEEVIREDASNMIALNNLAWMYLEIDQKKAINLAERAFRLAPEQPEVMDTFGWLLVKQGSQLERGVQLIKAALEKNPETDSIRYHYAYALAKSGDRQRAIAELDKAVESNRSFPELDQARALLQELKKGR